MRPVLSVAAFVALSLGAAAARAVQLRKTLLRICAGVLLVLAVAEVQAVEYRWDVNAGAVHVVSSGLSCLEIGSLVGSRLSNVARDQVTVTDCSASPLPVDGSVFVVSWMKNGNNTVQSANLFLASFIAGELSSMPLTARLEEWSVQRVAVLIGCLLAFVLGFSGGRA